MFTQKKTFVFFVHSLISDWNHGNAHFLRGIVTELLSRGHRVSVYEPISSWSLHNLVLNYGEEAVDLFHHHFPQLRSNRYETNKIDLDAVLEKADIVIVHEWNDHDLVYRIGMHRKTHQSYRLFFHDTHHRSVSDPESMKKYDLSNYDGVLAFGEIIKQIYLDKSWAARAWTWHEAADIRTFHPIESPIYGDVVWIGNWGDNERSEELKKFLFEPVKSLQLKGRIYGVRYPEDALQLLNDCELEYGSWTPNYLVPAIFSGYKFTVHVPRRPYVEMLPGIPTIRPFEALACRIPLICSTWNDCEKIFENGKDLLIAHNGKQMCEYMKLIMNDNKFSSQMAFHGRKTILEKHTCANRVDQLMNIYEEVNNKLQTRNPSGDVCNKRGNL